MAMYGGKINLGGEEARPVIDAGPNTKGLPYNSISGIITGLGEKGQRVQINNYEIGGVYDARHPGPKVLVAGNMDCGFFGEVSVEELFGTGNDSGYLFANADVPEGNPGWQGNPLRLDQPWLKMAWNGKVIFVAKTTIRRSISWDNIYRMGAVYGSGDVIGDAEQYMLDNGETESGGVYGVEFGRTPQTASITLGGRTYRIRLLRGTDADPNPTLYTRPGVGNQNEWNRLILPLHEHARDNNWIYPQYVNTHTPDWGAGYSDVELAAIRYPDGLPEILGSYSWCQETDGADPRRRTRRGRFGASDLNSNSSWTTHTNRGLRPVLQSL